MVNFYKGKWWFLILMAHHSNWFEEYKDVHELKTILSFSHGTITSKVLKLVIFATSAQL